MLISGATRLSAAIGDDHLQAVMHGVFFIIHVIVLRTIILGFIKARQVLFVYVDYFLGTLCACANDMWTNLVPDLTSSSIFMVEGSDLDRVHFMAHQLLCLYLDEFISQTMINIFLLISAQMLIVMEALHCSKIEWYSSTRQGDHS